MNHHHYQSQEYSARGVICRMQTARLRAARTLLAVWCVVWVALPLHVPVAFANPTGGTVASGSAQISGGPGGTVTINQSSQRAVVNWQNFSIQHGETTTFVQPSSSSATLNRVTGGSASQINGALNANGKVYLVNPQGVVVGKTGRVNTGGGFTASTLDVGDQEFMAGKGMTFKGSSRASVVNHGKIRATDGDVMLIARQVDNQGKISAKRGEVHLAGGQEVLVQPSGTAGQRVFIRGGMGSVSNSGSIRATAAELRAAGGNEYALAVNNSGVIRATAVDKSGGRIVLKAESSTGTGGANRVQNSGKLIAKAKAPGKNGGQIVVTGDEVHLASSSQIDASATYGPPGTLGKGGTVNIGGGFQGKDTSILNAKQTVVDAGSTINADGNSKGGTVVVWSDKATGYYGDISAKGPGTDATSGGMSPDGANVQAGSGGFVEVSSKSYLDFRGTANTAGGSVLLDPSNITLSAAPTSNAIGSIIVGSYNTGTSTAGDSTLNISTLLLLLANNNTYVYTDGGLSGASGLEPGIAGNNVNGDIAVLNDIIWSSRSSLYLLAHGDIIVRAKITNTAVAPPAGDGSVNLIAGWSGDLSNLGQNFATITASGTRYGNSVSGVPGSVYLYGGTTAGERAEVSSLYGDVNVAGYDVMLLGGTQTDSYARLGYSGSGAVGNITVLAKGTVSLTSGSDYGTYTRIGHTQNPSGNIIVSGADSATGLDVALMGGLFGGTPDSSTAAIGHGGFDIPTVSDYSGDISLLHLRSLSLNATSSPVRIGHSNDFNSATAVAMGNVSGNILITGVAAGMSVTINGSTTAGTGYAQIGHGAHRNGAAVTSGTISLSNVSSLSLTGEDAQGQIGHGGKSYNHANGRPAGLISGDITITGLSSGMTVSMIASPTSGGKEGYVMIGNGGYETDSTSISGTISLLNLGGASALTMQGGQAMAQIGHGGEISSQLDASGSLSGKITIAGIPGSAGMGMVMINAAGPHDILIGHGGHQANAYSINADIELTNVLNIEMEGFEQGAVQIGHGGFQFNNGLTGTRTITGGITITGRTSGAGIFMGPGSEAASYVQIGHGGFEGVLTSIDSAPIQMTSISLIDMFGGGSTSGSYSMIGHGGTRFNYQATGATSRSITNSAIGISGRADGAEIIVTGGTATDGFGFAQIGHGGFQSWFSDITTGSDITMSNVSSLTLKGRQGYAQAGHGGKYFNSSSGSATTLGVANINAGITITGLTSAGGMVVALSTFASGSTSSLSAYAQIGNGGYGAIVASMLNSTINISNVAILSMADNRSYVQIGHGGESFNANTPFAAGTIQGGITIAGRNTTGMVVDLNNASSDSSMLQIGHGGTRARISALTTANIDLTNASSLTATGVSGFIQIGHGGRFFNVAPLTAGSALSGNISISGLAIPGFAMNLTNDTATLTDADIQIGHGGYLSSVGDITSANIALTNITSLDLTANMAPVQIGHGGRQYNNVAGALGTGGISGFILIQGRSPINGATVNLRSNGNFDIATAHIGHGGPSAYFASITLADIDLSSISALSLVGNYGAAQVGHGGFSVFQGGYASNSVTGNITITGVTTGLGMTVSLSDQGNGGGYSQIGHGGHFTKIDSISSANISVLNVNILNLFAGSAYSQIGHGGLLFNSGTTGNTIQGGITIRGVPGGSGMFVTISTSAPTGIYAQIGHGGVSAESTVISLADIEMSIAKSIQVNAGESVAQIGHSVQGSGMTGKITLQGNGLTVRVAAIDANAQIGHGYYGMTGTGTYVVGGDILIDAPGGSLTIKGGQANGAYAQVGHGGISAASVPGNINLSGNIWIKTGDVTLTGGSVSGLGSYAMIGNGGTNVDRYSNISGQISIAATGETSIITLGTGASTFPWIGNRSGLLSTVGGNILLQTHTLDNAATTSLYSAVDLTMGLFMGNDLAHGDFTLLTDTDLSAGSIIGNGPGILSLLSKGNVGLFPQIRNTSNGDLYVAAGFDGTSGIFGDPSAVLVNQSFFLRPSLVAADIILVPGSFTSFSHNINLVAGKSINILSGAVISSGNTFLAITDNLNAVRPAVDTTATFTNSGSIVAPTIRIFAADPGTSTVGTLPGLPQKRGIWYGDSGALLNGVNFKTAVAVIPPPPVIPPVPPVDPVIPPVDPIPPIDPTPPIIPPIIIDPAPRLTMDASDLNTAVDTSDDILARRYGKFLTYTISYAPAPHSTNRDSILFMSSYSVFSRFTSLNSAAGPAAP